MDDTIADCSSGSDDAVEGTSALIGPIAKKNFVVLGVIAALSVAAIILEPEALPDAPQYRWYSILPPLLAVSAAIATGRVLVSLLSAVLIGGLLASVPAAPLSPMSWIRGLGQGSMFVYGNVTDSFNLQLIAFVVLVLSMISVVTVAGGLHGVIRWLSRFAKGPRSAQLMTAVTGLAVFIDDYANTMIVGTSMRPLTDRYKVSREKLAFIVDATSAPVAGLAVISTWVGYEVGLFQDIADSLAIDRGGYAMLFDALTFRFYCVLMIAFVFINVLTGKDFGPMARAERRAREKGEVAEADAVPMTSPTLSAAADDSARIYATTALLPIGLLFAFLLGGIWVDGGGMARLEESASAIFSFSVWRDTISASENAVMLLAYGAGFALLLGAVCARFLAKIETKAIGRATLAGIRGSLLPVTILILAWSLKSACDALETGPFLVAVVGESISPAWFPAIVFVIAAITSFATGTSYGTMAILIPTAVPIAFALEGGVYGMITVITLASILDGSIVGDHCSPISDTTVMSSIASSSDHMHHVRTQLPYSLTVAVLALFCGYIPAGLGAPAYVSYLAAILAVAALFAFLPAQAPVQIPEAAGEKPDSG